jgi:Cell cycle protein
VWLSACVPVVVGALVMLVGQAPFARWGGHLGAGVLGLALYAVLVMTRVGSRLSRSVATWAAIVALCLVASTLLSSGIDGMRRWHELGLIRIHPSQLLTPVLLVFAAGQLGRFPVRTHVLLIGLQAVHFLQPDAGQATALGVGAAGIVVATSGPRWRYLLALLYLATAFATWLRFDPLPPAPFVEDIVLEAFALTPVIGVAAVLALGLLIVAPLLDDHLDRASRPAAVALVGYFVGSLVAVRFGEFPVPLLGFGPSATLGAFLGFGALRTLKRDDDRLD